MKKLIVLIIFLLQFLILPNFVLADYSTFRYDFKRSGQSAFSITDNLVKVFTSPNVGSIQNQPAIDADGNIYASIWNGGLKVFNKDGQNIWSSETTEPSGTPAFDNEGNLYFCADTSNPKVYSFTKSGQKRWEYLLRPPGSYYSNPCMSSPAMSPNKDTLYVTTDWPTQTVLAFNLDGTVKWESKIWYTPSSASIAVADDGTLYVGTQGVLFSLKPNGLINWSKYGGTGFSTPVIGSDGNIYAIYGTWNGIAHIVSYTPSGQLRWNYQKSGWLAPEIAYRDNTIYAVSNDNKLLSLDSSSGSLKWIWQAPITTTLISSPSIDSNGVIFVSMKDTLYSIDPTGSKKWELPIANNISIPIIFDNNKILLYNRISGYIGNYYILGTPTPTPPAKTPIILIPGIGGSELKVNDTYLWSFPDGHGGVYNHTYPAGEKVWVNIDEGRVLGNDDYFDILRMSSDGQTSSANLELTGDIYSGAYQETINFFISNGYQLNKDLFIFPYDWRKDIALTTSLLDQKIENIKTQTGSQKVDIIAHSMGGLVARNYITDPTKAGKIRKLITLGTPHLGAVKFLKTLQHGDCMIYGNDYFCFSIAPSEIKDVIRNMISGYELAPSQKYYEFYNGSDNNHPLPVIDNRDIDNNGVTGFLNYTQIKTMLTNLNYNTSLFTPAEIFHYLDNNLSNANGVDVYIISGSGKATTGQIIEDYAIDFAGIKIPKTDLKEINGDGTVPLFSSSLTDGTKSIAGTNKIYYTNQEHGNLVFNGPAMNLVKNILNNDASLPPEVDIKPYHFEGNGLSVHSPVLIHAYDSNNNHTGPLPNGDFEVKIPGSSYEVLGDAKFIWLPDNGVYTLKFVATDNGSFDFKIRDYKNDINDKIILYKNIPLISSTKAETVFDTNSPTPPILRVDQDGNGSVDSQINPTSNLTGDAVYDHTPPQTIIKLIGDSGSDNWYKNDVMVELVGTDENNGSGILKTEYSLDNGQTVQTYVNPFTISPEGITNLKVKSIDNAGNEENIQQVEIKIDKTAPIVNLSADPKKLWPVNKKLVDVKISGNATDNISGVSSKIFSASDEYNKLNPVISDFNQIIKLEAWREGNDNDGRVYEIKIIVKDLAGNQQTAITQVLVPHDKREK